MRVFLITGLLTSFLSSIIITFTLVFFDMDTINGFGFYGFYFVVFLIYGAPAVFLYGLPISFLIEFLFNRIKIKNRNRLIVIVTYIITYASAGFIGSFIYFLVFTEGGRLQSYWNQDFFIFSEFGVIAALLFLIIRYYVEVVFKKIKSGGTSMDCDSKGSE